MGRRGRVHEGDRDREGEDGRRGVRLAEAGGGLTCLYLLGRFWLCVVLEGLEGTFWLLSCKAGSRTGCLIQLCYGIVFTQIGAIYEGAFFCCTTIEGFAQTPADRPAPSGC